MLDGVAEYVAFVYTFYENEGGVDLAFTINDIGDDLLQKLTAIDIMFQKISSNE